MIVLKLKYIPNVLSVIRLTLVGVFATVFFGVQSDTGMRAALIVFVVAEVTDVADGFLARRYGWITDAGKILDPLADKLMQCTALTCLTISKMIPVWYAAPYILKELVMLCGGFIIIRKRKIVVVSNIFGKGAAVMFFATICAAMLISKPYQPAIPWQINALCAVSLGLTVLALVMYGFEYVFVRPKKKSDPDNSGEESKQ